MLSPKTRGEAAAPADVPAPTDRSPFVLPAAQPHSRNGHVPLAKPARKAIFILDQNSLDVVYGPEAQAALGGMVDLYAPPQTRESVLADTSLLREAEILLTGWGAPRLDEEFLACAPGLRAVFYAAGSIRPFVTPASWRRGITVTCAADANAEPVCEYTLGVILLGLRGFWRFAADARQGLGWGDHTRSIAGGYRSTVGLVSCGAIARKVAARLATFDVKCLVYDPFVSPAEAARLGLESCSLEEVFARSDVVSLHAPELPATRGLVTEELFLSMKPGAMFINTARGAIVRQEEMIAALRQRPDLQAVLDVCVPEPLELDSPLFSLPNVVLTPHIAGSMGPECRRLGQTMVDEVRRYLAGEPLRWQVTEAEAARLA